MYSLMLVSMERVCDRFQGPTDSKNYQNRMVIRAIPLQQGSLYKWTPTAVHHLRSVVDIISMSQLLESIARRIFYRFEKTFFKVIIFYLKSSICHPFVAISPYVRKASRFLSTAEILQTVTSGFVDLHMPTTFYNANKLTVGANKLTVGTKVVQTRPTGTLHLGSQKHSKDLLRIY